MMAAGVATIAGGTSAVASCSDGQQSSRTVIAAGATVLAGAGICLLWHAKEPPEADFAAISKEERAELKRAILIGIAQEVSVDEQVSFEVALTHLHTGLSDPDFQASLDEQVQKSINSLREAFLSKADSSGCITKENARAATSAHMSDEQFDILWRVIDRNEDEKISLSEYLLNFAMEVGRDTPQQLKATFTALDADGDHEISFEEMQQWSKLCLTRAVEFMSSPNKSSFTLWECEHIQSWLRNHENEWATREYLKAFQQWHREEMSMQEFQERASYLAQRLTDCVFEKYDLNNDRKLQWNEFEGIALGNDVMCVMRGSLVHPC